MTTHIVPSPWAQLDGETAKAYEGFKTYRDLKPSERSAAKVALLIGKSSKLTEVWCAKNKWVERANAWDAYIDQRETENRLATVDTVGAMITQNLASQVSTVNRLVEMQIAEMEHRANNGDLPTVKELKDMVALLKEKDILLNRIAGGAAYGIKDETYEL